MKDSDKMEFAALMGELSLSFLTEPSKETMRVYFKRLGDCSMNQVRKAINQIIETDDRFPVLSRLKTVALTFRREVPVVSDALQIEEVVLPNGLPTTKDDFLKAMKDLGEKFDVDPDKVQRAKP